MEISKKMLGTITEKWGNSNVELLYKLVARTTKGLVVVRILKDDFNNVEIGDTVEIVEKKELSLFTRCNSPYYEFVEKIN